MLCTIGVSSSRSLRVRRSSSPSLMPRQSTNWQFTAMPPFHKAGQVLEHLARALVGQHPHPELGFVVWTEILIGEMCILMMRSISWSCMFVMVM